ncbi:MAG: lytic transglycosylase domain-containing protein [Terriglobales bacterium]
MKTWTKIAALLGTFIILFCVSVSATDLAVLQNGFTIPHDHREIIGSITRLYIDRGNTSYVDVPTVQIVNFEPDLTTPPAAKVNNPRIAATPSVALTKPAAKTSDLNDLINSASDHTQIDPDLINSVIHVESGYNPRALSPKGAQGLMQLMPKTAANLGVANSFDPGANVDGGTRYLRQLLELYNFDLQKALAAYNAGPLRVKQYHGVPPYNETRAYVARIIRDFNRKKLAEQKAAALAAKNKKSAIQKSPPVTQITVERPGASTSR